MTRGRPKKRPGTSIRWGHYGNSNRSLAEVFQCIHISKIVGGPGERFHRYACSIKPRWRTDALCEPRIWVKHTCIKCGKWEPGENNLPKDHKYKGKVPSWIKKEPEYEIPLNKIQEACHTAPGMCHDCGDLSCKANPFEEEHLDKWAPVTYGTKKASEVKQHVPFDKIYSTQQVLA